MVRASVSVAVDSGLIPIPVKPMTSKLIFTGSLLDDRQERDSVVNKPASLPVVPLVQKLNNISPSWCVGQMAGNF